ncbi:MAG: L,D-transpeptidase family protein [Erysipelotrichaceae bacterium]|nr:L,D-transpeptidase family protein [Erysipelotrichaceae bacterium]
MKKLLIAFLTLILILGGLYVGGLYYGSSHFLPKTTINGIDVSMKNVEEANEAMKDLSPVLSVIERNTDGNTSVIDTIDLKKDLGASITYDTEELLLQQNVFLWFRSFFKETELSGPHLSGTYDESKLEGAISSLYCMKEENIIPPTEAHIEFKDGDFSIVEANNGCMIDKDVVLQQVKKAVEVNLSGANALNLDLFYFYKKAPEADMDALNRQIEDLKPVLDKRITLLVDTEDADRNPVWNKSVFLDWLVFEDGVFKVNDATLSEAVNDLAKEYDTNSAYINKTRLKERLMDAVLSKVNVNVTVPWTSRANSVDTDVEKLIRVIISEQTLYYYEKGSLVMTSPIVSGYGPSLLDDGTYYVQHMKQGATLRGSDYEEHVDYWIGFGRSGHYSNGGHILGIHDASWRSEFGGDIYKTDPSHGCINLPTDKEAKLYSLVDIGTVLEVIY